jgi:FMN phosphatase YigB (HAD superfamily)
LIETSIGDSIVAVWRYLQPQLVIQFSFIKQNYLSTNASLAQMLSDLPFPKYIFTNAREREAIEALVALGIESHFDKIYGADFLGDVCKV